jgi:hypothetical protein
MMAIRPVFVSATSGNLAILEIIVAFHWFPGMSRVQKQRNVRAIHEAAREQGIEHPLEVSTRSENELGIALSAFNLTLHVRGLDLMPVESAFQGGKVFKEGGPYTDLYSVNPHQAKRDPRLSSSGPLIAFKMQDESWPLEPKTAFYDWLYITALQQNQHLASVLSKYDGFTDIEFNPRKSFSTQARSCALFVALQRSGKLEEALASKEAFLRYVGTAYEDQELGQPRLL